VDRLIPFFFEYFFADSIILESMLRVSLVFMALRIVCI
jgi:hypothetical protein